MKLAAAPCVFKCYNNDNSDGSDKSKYYVSSFSFEAETGPVSDVVSGNLYVDQISVSASISVIDPITSWTGEASFVFPAQHWAFALDGHPTLAEKDVVTKSVDFTGVVAALPVKTSFAITAEIESSGQSVYDDWSFV
jgi:hypothetical protein